MKTLTLSSSFSDNNRLEDQKSSKVFHRDIKKERNRKQFKSQGTTTSGEQVERKSASASGVKRQLNLKPTFQSSNRPNTCENVVRIPGARPFFKQ